MKVVKEVILALCLLFIAQGLVFGGDEIVVKRATKEFNVSSNAQFGISNIAGDIKIESWNKNKIQIDYTIYGKGDDHSEAKESVKYIKLDFEKSGNKVYVKVEHKKSGFLGFGKNKIRGRVDFKVQIPKDCSADASTISGDLYVKEVKSHVDASNISGDTMLRDIKGNLNVSSVSGDIVIKKITGKVRGRFVSGDVVIKSVKGSLSFEGVSGSVMVSESFVDKFEVETVSGDIEYLGELSKNGKVEVESTSGDIQINLTNDVKFNYYLSSFSGDLNVYGSDIGRLSGSRKLRGKSTRGAEAVIEADTLSGDIVIRVQ